MANHALTTEAVTIPEAMRDAVERAKKGDRKAAAALRGLLEKPGYVDALGGDLARQIQHALIRSFSQEVNLLWEEVLPRKLEQLRAELAGPAPAPLERLLVERVVTCWLHLHHLEIVYAQKRSMTLQLADHYQRCLDRAQRRYLAAIKTLAVVRKLAVPALLQVNIADRQVNVAGRCLPAAGDAETP